MSILDRIKAKIMPTNQPTPQPDRDGTIGITVSAEEKKAAQQGEYKIPVAVGEYFPWKGHIFQVTESGALTFTAVCKGLTRRRADELGLV